MLESAADKKAILVIDDNPENVKILASLLMNNDYRVRPVLNGKTALKSARKNPPDLILLDIMMPEPDGYEICEKLKSDEKTRNIPVIFISALNEVSDKIKGFSLGGVDYITKPFHSGEVLIRVKTHLALRDMQARLEYKNLQLEKEIAERRRTEEALKKARKKAEDASKAKTIFLANMSHELRTPLNGILGYAQVLKQVENISDFQIRCLDTIERSGNHLLNLINDILDLSKIEASKTGIVNTNFSLSEFLTEVSDMMYIRAYEKGISFQYKTCQLPQFVSADKKRLRQVLLNLLGNAIKFTYRGGVMLKVENVYSDIKSRIPVIRFQVSDTGIGIPEDKLNEIFLPFKQLDNKSKIEGTGLGLAISCKLVHLMKGELKVTSTLGKGSVFRFDLKMPEVLGKAEKEKTYGRDVKKFSFDFDKPESIIPPSENDLAELMKMALMGDIRAIQQQLERLAEQEELKPFTAGLDRLTKNFQIEKIRDILSSFEKIKDKTA